MYTDIFLKWFRGYRHLKHNPGNGGCTDDRIAVSVVVYSSVHCISIENNVKIMWRAGSCLDWGGGTMGDIWPEMASAAGAQLAYRKKKNICY